ncbi:tyrosine-phosphatase [Zalerion maritima]|uniref:M-phase inducer phosphatase n=1 Tax=Zalerion maritima TaxID=339359 RepID=A0AAD5RVZ3_9PEZI|nr:tyrosine-phosphatase [Zalerion maritima]
MDTSSPLAAMHPPRAPAMSWEGCKPAGLFSSSSLFGNGCNASLRERLHGKGKNDYFSAQPLRGSSPAASLAADLSQNFRLDNESSPNFPTPRRSLFTSNLMSGMEGGRDYVTTPPIPTSSPVPVEDFMDVSPLPHKVASCTQIEVDSPSPALALSSQDEDSEMLIDVEDPSPVVRPLLAEQARHASVAERRKLGVRRPSLTRAKGYSISGVSSRFASDSQLQTFKFGGESRFEAKLQSQSSSLSLDECFTASPSQEKRPSSANSPCVSFQPFPRRPQFNLGAAGLGSSRSPMPCHARRQSNPFNRPRKQYRRSQSMFDAAGDVLQQESAALKPVLAPVADVSEQSQEPIIPHHFTDDITDRIPRISRDTLLSVLNGQYNHYFDTKMIIDCRFEYEYEGGHIDGAINYNDKELLTSHLFKTPMDGKTLLIFHCEFSAHRAPLMARHIRSQDRTANAASYPKLTYPEVYILEGGYQNFYNQHRNRCYPQSYVEMNDASHINTCEREMDRIRNYRPGRKQIGRAATFAFGQNDESSPTAQPRPSRRAVPTNLASASPLISLHGPNRLPSY